MSKGFGNMMRQAQQMKKQMQIAQEKIEAEKFEGQAGQGKVRTEISGAYEVKSVSIDKDVIDPEDPDTLQDLISVALNDALGKVTKAKGDQMEGLTGGLNIPGLF